MGQLHVPFRCHSTKKTSARRRLSSGSAVQRCVSVGCLRCLRFVNVSLVCPLGCPIRIVKTSLRSLLDSVQLMNTSCDDLVSQPFAQLHVEFEIARMLSLRGSISSCCQLIKLRHDDERACYKAGGTMTCDLDSHAHRPSSEESRTHKSLVCWSSTISP